jgi:hypothetical protein
VAICDECVHLSGRILDGEPATIRPPSDMSAADRLTDLPDDVLLAGLRRRSVALDGEEQQTRDAVAVLRARKVTWTRIGAALRMSRQAAWERYAKDD